MKVLGTAAVAMLVAGCASDSTAERPARPTVTGGEFGTSGCFTRRVVQDFQALDDQNLIVFAPGKTDAYHVQVSPRDPDVRFATLLAFESRSSQICGHAGDNLILENQRRLFITGVYRLDAAALAGLRARFGKGPLVEKTKPQPGEGAEIERDIGSQEQHQR